MSFKAVNPKMPNLVNKTHINFILIPRFNMMTLTGMIEPLRIANYLSPNVIFTHSFHSFDGDQITANNGMVVPCVSLPDRLQRKNTVVVLGSWGREHYSNTKMESWLRLQNRMGARICGVEIGSYVLARAGLLSGQAATTHWSHLAGFVERFPDVQPTDQIFTDGDKILTCAGATGSIDMILHLIQRNHGETIVNEIADQMLHHHVRPADTPQRMTDARGLSGLPKAVRAAIQVIEGNITDPLTVPEVAAAVEISQRQLERLIHKSMGCSVVQLGLALRLQHARVLLVSTELSVREIATASGFVSVSHFAHTYRKYFDKRPSEQRLSWPEEETPSHWPGTLSNVLKSMQIDGTTS